MTAAILSPNVSVHKAAGYCSVLVESWELSPLCCVEYLVLEPRWLFFPDALLSTALRPAVVVLMCETAASPSATRVVVSRPKCCHTGATNVLRGCNLALKHLWSCLCRQSGSQALPLTTLTERRAPPLSPTPEHAESFKSTTARYGYNILDILSSLYSPPCLLPSTQGRTSLHQAAVKGDVDEVGFLLSSGANPNTQDAHLQVTHDS